MKRRFVNFLKNTDCSEQQYLKRALLFNFLIILFVGALLAWVYAEQINPDGIAYLKIASRYANLDIARAINGYWSPLLSLLLVPFIWVGIEPIHAYRIIVVIVVLVITSNMLLMINNRVGLKQSFWAKLTVSISIGLIMLVWGVQVITPDILSGAILLFSIEMAQKFYNKPDFKNGLLSGSLFALVYLSKAAAISVALVCLTVVIVFLLLSKYARDNNLKKYAAILLLAFTSIVLSWSALISYKYHKVTISTAGSYNLALAGPDKPSHPHSRYDTILPSKYNDDIWAWDDPSVMPPLPTWSIMRHKEFYLRQIINNLNTALIDFSTLSPLLIGAVIILILKKQRALADNMTLFAAIGCILAYSLVFIEPRYLWLAALPLMFYGWTALFDKQHGRTTINVMAIFVSAVSLLNLFPIYQDATKIKYVFSSNSTLARSMAATVPAGSRVAGPQERFEYCYFAKWNCISQYVLANDERVRIEQIDHLRSSGIKYYFEAEAPKELGLKLIKNSVAADKKCHNWTNDLEESCPLRQLSMYEL